tara:strand:- start:264 stop:815 length:552 start_codon:yes stop_codon:yes gene_type:complete
MKLIEILPEQHNILISLAYASNNNFTRKKIYKNERSFLREEAFLALEKTISIASKMGLKIKIFDTFRPVEAQRIMWNFNPNPEYIANPEYGSPHSRGIAIDLTLCTKDNTELDMGTPFDSFSKKSHHDYLDFDYKILQNRSLLLGIMTLSGWDFYKNEWWHYQLYDSKKYPLLTDKAAGTNLI